MTIWKVSKWVPKLGKRPALETTVLLLTGIGLFILIVELLPLRMMATVLLFISLGMLWWLLYDVLRSVHQNKQSKP